MRNTFFFKLFVLLIFTNFSCNQSDLNVTNQVENPSSKLDQTTLNAINSIPQNTTNYKHQVMVLGSFHFNKNTDGSDIVAKNHIDVTSAESQSQIEALVDKIATEFKPTLIAVEWMPRIQGKIDTLYQNYLKDESKLNINEAFQIGFRVAKKLNLPGVTCVDNRPPQPETVTSVDDWDLYAQEQGHEALWHEYDDDNDAFNNFMDERLSDLNLKQYLALLNSPEAGKRNKAIWLTGLVNLGVGDKFLGADLTGYWYRRNTRILVNTRNACSSQQERVLLIYGNAHRWILEELFEGSPEFEVIPSTTVLY